jgi:protein MpaA
MSMRTIRNLSGIALLTLGLWGVSSPRVALASGTPPAAPATAKATKDNKDAKGGKAAATGSKAARDDIAPIHIKPQGQAPILSSHKLFCAEMVKRLPNVSRTLCDQSDLQPTGVKSVSGQPLFQRDVVSPNARLRVLVIGGIHGDELSSTALALHWVSQAMETPSNIHWRFVPLMNPDGMLGTVPTRTNANGVDLNRNFPTPNWDKEAPRYWNVRTKNDPRRYPGVKPLSEPESRWLFAEMENWKPNLIVSIHAPYGVLDFDGPTVAPQRLGRLFLDQVGIFPGSLGNYGGVHKKVPVVTIELSSALRTPQEGEMRQMWLDLLRWTAERLGAD